MKLEIVATGALQQSNFAEFKAAFMDWLVELPQKPATDTEFGDAEQAIREIAEKEKLLKQAAEAVLSQMAEVNAVITDLGKLGEHARGSRLALEKAVNAQKTAIKAQLLKNAVDTLPPGRPQKVIEEMRGAMSNKRTLASIQAALSDTADLINTMHAETAAVLNAADPLDMPDRASLQWDTASQVAAKLAPRKALREARAQAQAEQAAQRKALMDHWQAVAQATASESPAPVVKESLSAQPASPAPATAEESSVVAAPEESSASAFAAYRDAVKAALQSTKPLRAAIPPGDDADRAKKFATTIIEAFALYLP